MTIIGIDPSLTSTGISDGITHILAESKPGNDLLPTRDIVRRVFEQFNVIDEFIQARIGDSLKYRVYIEDVMKSMSIRPTVNADGEVKTFAVGAGHLFEMGVWFGLWFTAMAHPTVLVNPGQLKTYVGGRANFPKSRMQTTVFRKWGIDFGEHSDSGADKLHAFCLVKLGEEVERGTYQLNESKRRGQGSDAKAAARRNSR